MKKKSLHAFLLVVAVTLGMALKAAAQNVSVSLNAQNAKLETVLNDIEKQTNYLFVYDKNINVQRSVSIVAEQKNLREALAQLFAGTDIAFAVEGSNIVLSQKQGDQKTRAIEGRVTNEAGAPLAGVIVAAKGSQRGGTTTSASGTFSLNIDDNVHTLAFSFLGMEPKEVNIGNMRNFNVVLSESEINVGEVVVTALGLSKEVKTLSYNVQQIANSDLTTVKDANFVNALSGKVAGVTINASSSGVGGSSRVVMRGTKSLNCNNNALYVIDGIPMPQLLSDQPGSDMYSGAGQSGDGIASINPEDVESLSVLSGPSAATLYGSKGSNGVVLITTKKGTKSGASASYSNNTTFFSPLVMPKFQNTYGMSSLSEYRSWGDRLNTSSSYSPNDFFRTGFNTTNAVTVQTGSEKSQTFLSLGSVNAAGIIPNNDMNRYNVTFRNTTDFLNGRLAVDVGFMYSSTQEQNMVSQGQYSNPLIPLYLFPPGDDFRKYQVYERYDAARFLKTQFWPYGDQGLDMQNPYWIANRNLFQNNKERYIINGAARLKINDFLNLAGRVKVDNSHRVLERKYYASTLPVLASENGFYSNRRMDNKYKYADAILTFDKKFGDFSVNANLGGSIEDERFEDVRHEGKLAVVGTGVANQFYFENISETPGDYKYLQDGYHDQLQAAFATAQLGYKSIWLDLSGRNEWASQLAFTDRTSYFYGSAGLSAVLTDLLPIKSNVLSFLKVRGSFAGTANPPQRWLSNPSINQSQGSLPSLTTDMPFNLKPERTNSWEAGWNAAFWKNKVRFDITLYKSNTLSQVVHGDLSPSSGFSGFYINTGNVSNKGVEASLGLQQNLGPVLWNTSAIFSLNRNRIEELVPSGTTNALGQPVDMSRINLGGNATYHQYLYEGGTMSDLYVNKLLTDEHGYIYVNQQNLSIQADPGGPETYAGHMDPSYNLSWRNGFSWKGVDFDFMFSARVGGVGISVTQALMDGYGVSQASADARDGKGAMVNGYYIPAINYYSVVGAGTGVGSMYVYSATNVRLSEVSLSYTIPFGPKIGRFVKNVTLSAIGRNLWMIYCKAPFDPESTATTGTYFTGVDYFRQPSLRSVGFSAKLTF
ncbi:MAG: SusC/RagA family TonB-linked outer membrane protein [Rikenellaceae bacterium]|jgi:TonB-linked SusC/RagA family outer membrane protein|nr:SusC/RagA family TonB-linked outer membrane protein [Rikenellaceae bacterium]